MNSIPQTQTFYLIKRKGKRKKQVYYYRVYDESGKVIGEWTTRCNKKHDANIYCLNLLNENKLIPDVKKKSARSGNPSLFKDYFKDWFLWEKDEEPECPYIKNKLKAGKSFSRQTASIYRSILVNYLIPEFGNRPKDKISKSEIQDWLFALSEENEITARTANNCYAVLRTIMTKAFNWDHISSNPTGKKIETLGNDGRKKDILKWFEVDKLFNTATALQVWGDPLSYVGTLLAATTGMRTGEIRGLLVENIHQDHIVVKHSVSAVGNELGETKSRKERIVPIPTFLYNFLKELSPKEGYVFSLDGGKNPLNHKYLLDHFKTALSNIGIKRETQTERNVVFHSWRVFFNTVLQVNHIPDAKIRAIIGHENNDMTKHYTKISYEDYIEENQMTIPQIQIRIVRGKYE